MVEINIVARDYERLWHICAKVSLGLRAYLALCRFMREIFRRTCSRVARVLIPLVSYFAYLLGSRGEHGSIMGRHRGSRSRAPGPQVPRANYVRPYFCTGYPEARGLEKVHRSRALPLGD